MQRVFRGYEQRKEERGSVDFEDLLAGAVGLFERDADALGVVQARYRAFTVDEYQDVNLLQQTLLELWLGERDDLCAVGDDYQAIYAFTGATPRHLLELPERYPARDRRPAGGQLPLDARGARAREPARPEARRRAEDACGRRASRGPSPWRGRSRRSPTSSTSSSSGFARCTRRASRSTAMAVLYRLNARSADFEAAFAEAKIPFQGAALLERDAARQLLKVLRGREELPALEEVRRVALEHGLMESPPQRIGEREETRQKDLKLLVSLARRRRERVACSSSPTCERASRAARPAACTCSRTTARRGSSSTRCSSRASTRASCRRSARRPTTRSRKSGACSTWASRARDGT